MRDEYEDMAIGVLDSIRAPSDAMPLLTLLPWYPARMRGTDHKTFNVLPLWTKSPLELAVADDATDESMQCMRFVSHRHSQYALEQYFIGEFPGSMTA